MLDTFVPAVAPCSWNTTVVLPAGNDAIEIAIEVPVVVGVTAVPPTVTLPVTNVICVGIVAVNVDPVIALLFGLFITTVYVTLLPTCTDVGDAVLLTVGIVGAAVTVTLALSLGSVPVTP